MDYNEFSNEFNATRQNLWPELLEFEKYVKNNQKILDLGCGNGRLVNLLKNYDIEYVGSDISSDLLNYAKKQDFGKIKNFQFIESDMLDLEFQNNSFDIIFLIASYHHLRTKSQRIKILTKMKNWLKEDGIIIMTNWNLFQRKYIKYIFNLEKKSWNDFLIPWKGKGRNVIANRFYHGFRLGELDKLAKNTQFRTLENGYSNTKRNIITVLSKK